MQDTDFWDFMTEGGDELLNSEICPKCKDVIYLDQAIEWIDKQRGTCICPHCGEKVKISI